MWLQQWLDAGAGECASGGGGTISVSGSVSEPEVNVSPTTLSGGDVISKLKMLHIKYGHVNFKKL